MHSVLDDHAFVSPAPSEKELMAECDAEGEPKVSEEAYSAPIGRLPIN